MIGFTKRLEAACLAAGLALAPPAALGQDVRGQDALAARLGEASRALGQADGPFPLLDEAGRLRIAEFVAGNALFTLAHELGHAAIAEFDLPVLGREEDAADAFATLSLLHIGTEFSHRVLVDAARGLILIAERDARLGAKPAFYGEHGLDQQRAYAIVCLMVGSDPAAFADLAQRAGLPAERGETCQIDFEQARTSWSRLLQPHFRGAAKPSFWERLFAPRGRATAGATPIAVSYGEAAGGLAPFRQAMQSMRLLEEVARFAGQSLAFPRPLTIEARLCGDPNAYWDPQRRSVVICYELLAFHAGLAPQR